MRIRKKKKAERVKVTRRKGIEEANKQRKDKVGEKMFSLWKIWAYCL